MKLDLRKTLLCLAIATLATACGGGGGGTGGTGGQPGIPDAPIVQDLAGMLDFDTSGIDSPRKGTRPDPRTDRISNVRPGDLDQGGPIGGGGGSTPPVGDPTGLSGANRTDTFAQGGRPSGIDDGGPGKDVPSPIGRDAISRRPETGGIVPGAPTPVPAPIDPPTGPIPPIFTKGGTSNDFDNWVISNPPPVDGGDPPSGERPQDAVDVSGTGPRNFPGAITHGGPDKKKGGEEEPVPEPETYLLLLVGLAAVWYCRKR